MEAQLSTIKFRIRGIFAVILDDGTIWKEPRTVSGKKKSDRFTTKTTHYPWRQAKVYEYGGRKYVKLYSQRGRHNISETQLKEWLVPVDEQVVIPGRTIPALQAEA